MENTFLKPLIFILIFASLMVACSSTTLKTVKETHTQCSHPAVAGGAPFELNPKSTITGDVITTEVEDTTYVLLGAQCISVTTEKVQ